MHMTAWLLGLSYVLLVGAMGVRTTIAAVLLIGTPSVANSTLDCSRGQYQNMRKL